MLMDKAAFGDPIPVNFKVGKLLLDRASLMIDRRHGRYASWSDFFRTAVYNEVIRGETGARMSMITPDEVKQGVQPKKQDLTGLSTGEVVEKLMPDELP